MLTFMVLAIIRGDLVPGYLYKNELAQRLKAEEQASRNAEALTALAKAATNGKPVARRG